MSKNEITETAFFIPKNVSYAASRNLHEHMEHKMLTFYHELRTKGWTFYAVDQERGRCYYHAKVITIPVWALVRGRDYGYWYISHEMAHAYAGAKANHGPHFMECLKLICPAYALRHEHGYKPRNATNAGILKIDQNTFEEL